MRELVYYVAVSLDGFIASPDGQFSDFLDEGDHMQVVLQDYVDAVPTHFRQILKVETPCTLFDTVIMGRNTLQPALDVGITSPYRHLHQFVVSTQELDIDPSITVLHDIDQVLELKKSEGLNIWLCGGGRLAGSLLPYIDRLILKRNPVVLGAGISLFGNREYSPAVFQLLNTRVFSSGVIFEEYHRSSE